MAYCDECGNYDQAHIDGVAEHDKRLYHNEATDYRPELYYYWDAPLEEDYDWRDEFPEADCLCDISFDIANEEGKIKWACIITVCKHYIVLASLSSIIEV